MIIRLFALIAASLCLATSAQAQSIFWSSPASVCTPDAATATGDKLKTNTASVQYATGKTGALILNCQVLRFDPGAFTKWNLGIAYVDPTGTATTAHVRARLYRIPVGSGTPVVMSTVISNSSADTALKNLESAQFNHTFDFNQNVYWVRIDLQRNSTQAVILHSVYFRENGV